MSAAKLHAILLTDLVESTQLAGTLGDAAYADLAHAHDRLARDLLQAWRGREIDKSDGMLMLFGSAADAAGYAVAYHRALASLPHRLMARAGIHFGPVVLHVNDSHDVTNGAKLVEVEGLAKAIAARAMALALGGQTLLTAEAREALGPTSLRVISHGHWRVKGVAEPFELFEVGEAGAPFKPPPDGAKGYRVVRRADLWMPLHSVAHSLPAERDSFVGRREPLAELAERFGAGARLISVLGIGGSGKTRLATRYAWQWLGDFPGGAWFCDLSAARGVDGIVYAVAQGLDLPLGKGDPVAQIGQAIAGRGACLVILDNFEQVARHADETLGRWLDRAADAQFLVTTREVLGLAGEATLALKTLPPAEAAALFVQRAADAGAAAIAPEGVDGEAIPRLVSLLDGLPLAIELAAARARLMQPRALLARMDQRFRLLSAGGGRRDRQATLRATFDWSWEMLSATEKTGLAQLSVFEGGFTLEAAEAVLDLTGGDGAPAWTVDTLQSLVDKSFVRPAANGRFGLLGTVQEYAAEHLRTAGRYPSSGPDALAAALQRHGACFANWPPPRNGAAPTLETENLIVACRRAVARGDADIAVATLEHAWTALQLHGPFSAGVDLGRAARALAGLTAAQRAGSDIVVGMALDATGQVDAARVVLEAALPLARSANDLRLQTRARIGLGTLHANEARADQAAELLQAALLGARELRDVGLECNALNALGSLHADLGELEKARLHYAEALEVARAAGNRHWEGGVLGNLGGLLFDLGKPAEAARYFEAGLAVARELGNRSWEGNALCNLGALHQTQGRFDEAIVECEAALDLALALGHARLQCVVRCNLGLVEYGLQRWDRAGAAFDAALALAAELQDRRSEGLLMGYIGRLQARRSQFDEARRFLLRGERLLTEARDRYGLGLLQCGRAEVEQLAGAQREALDALAKADAIATELSAGPESELGVALARVGGMAGRDPEATGS